MDDATKNAYRYLLYWSILEIRQVAWMRFRWWRPLRWRRNFQYMRYAGDIADWLHNLAAYSSLDFAGFREDWFWSEYERLKERYGITEAGVYREAFQKRLSELKNGV